MLLPGPAAVSSAAKLKFAYVIASNSLYYFCTSDCISFLSLSDLIFKSTSLLERGDICNWRILPAVLLNTLFELLI